MRGDTVRGDTGSGLSTDASLPAVSVIMANYNSGPHLATAVRSVLRQTLSSLELIVADDGSTDGSLEAARAAAAEDGRVIVIEGGGRTGPASTRNRALARARGRWIAIVDGDDYIHPERLETLIGAAERDGADIVADDLLVFYDDGSKPPHAFLAGRLAVGPSWVSAPDYIRSNVVFSGQPSIGYLKPVIRRAASPRGVLAYDETLRIGEDYDLIAQLMLKGARMRIYPEPLYFYRKHASSISHRLSAADLDGMLAAHDAMSAAIPGHSPAGRALARRRASLADARVFCDLVDGLKARSPDRALAAVAKRPSSALLLRIPLADRLARLVSRPQRKRTPSAGTRARIVLLSRQRIVGATNGSSNYVLTLVRAFAEAGYDIDFIGASPTLFGSWPLLRLRPETGVFSRYLVNGGARLGPYIVATDPRIALRGALAAVNYAAKRLLPAWPRPPQAAPYSVAARAKRRDLLYVARTVRPGSRAVFCDYAFLTPLAPYATTHAPEAQVATIMHDLISARVHDDAEPPPPEIAQLTAAEEFRLLSQSDLVIAIQPEEEAQVREHLPLVKTIVAPWAVEPLSEPQLGEDDTLLFVGSNTAPNIGGVKWFLDACWPIVQRERPQAQLLVAGSVSRSLPALPRNVRSLGVVDALAPLYRDAGVVIAPLRTGSGLKIKLVEALAAGKAVVGTPVSAKGVESFVEPAMLIADEPELFARAILSLMGDRTRRLALAAAALACVEAHFSPVRCYAPLIERIGGREGARRQPEAA